ncbi:MAG: DUF4349 domain-containing protein [Bacillota bacterium]
MRRSFNYILCILFILGITFSLAACSNGPKSAAPADKNLYRGETNDASYAPADKKTGTLSEADLSETNNKSTSVKKIIKNADIDIEVKKAEDAFNKITSWINESGGYEFNLNMSEREGHKYIQVVYKVPPQKLSSFISFLGTVSTVKHSNITSNDITDEYYDTQSRLQNLKNGRDQLLEIQKKAVTIDEILKVQNELNRITGEIEVLEGKINLWNKLVDESTVNISIAEESDPLKPTAEVKWNFSSPGNILKTMQNGFILVANFILNLIIWILIAIVSLSPVILIGAAIFFIIKWSRKRKKLKKAPELTNNKDTSVS